MKRHDHAWMVCDEGQYFSTSYSWEIAQYTYHLIPLWSSFPFIDDMSTSSPEFYLYLHWLIDQGEYGIIVVLNWFYRLKFARLSQNILFSSYWKSTLIIQWNPALVKIERTNITQVFIKVAEENCLCVKSWQYNDRTIQTPASHLLFRRLFGLRFLFRGRLSSKK